LIVKTTRARVSRSRVAPLGLTALLLGGAGISAERAPGDVDAARLAHADAEPQNWFTGGRDIAGTYYSPLTGINAANIDQLGFAWQYDLATNRGQEATPIVIDGVMYTSGTWGYVYALDAATGRELWHFIPQMDDIYARNPCCDLVNRGVAVFKGMVYVASVDGHLHALNAATGRQVWEADTLIDHKLPYSSTGAPQIAGDVVVIGNGGADMGHLAVRGYVAAYDLQTGAFKWRFWTVPPPVGQPYENPELAAADKTWDPHRPAEFNGGGTAWDGLAYDPQLRLLYVGTANAAPYDSRRHGAPRVVLPDHPARQLGFRCRAEIHACRCFDRRQVAPGDHAGQQERLFLRARSPDWKAPVGQPVQLCELGLARGYEKRPADRHEHGRLVREAADHLPLMGRRAHLESDVLQRTDAPGLHPGRGRAGGVGRPASQRRQGQIHRWLLHGQRRHRG
jgi:hypothetical protein